MQNVTNKLNGTDYSVLPDYSIGSANSYDNTGGYNNYANYSATDYTVNTENLMGKPSSYFQDNNSADWSSNTAGIGSSSNSGFNQNTNFGASSSYGTTPTLWSNNATNVQSSPTVQNVSNYNNIDAQKQAQILQAQRDAVNQILMNGMDVLYGMNRTINGMTFGGLDYLGQKFGFDSQMNNYLQLKNPQERELAQNVGQLAQLGGGALTGGALTKTGLNQANIAYNKLTQWNSKRNLTNQLQRGNNFKDIYMGKIDRDKLNTLNSVRRSEGAEFIHSRKVNIPKDRVQHIYEERIIGDGYTPKEAADTIYDAVFNPKSKIQASRYKTLQKFDSPTPNRAIVGKIRDGNSIFIKTGYRK